MEDYTKLGLKVGLEIHQRLETHKLFCKCPSVMRDEEPDITVKRKLRAVAGETGKIDEAALHEMQKEQEFIYQAYSDTTCLVELDEEPPGQLNQDALETTMQVAKMLNAHLVDQVHFMRKTVVDGSNTSGFQRTALVGTNGYIETSQGKVSIGFVCLEEESAKNVKEADNERTWRLDRLGIPLIEIQTGPDIKTPEHAKEVAEQLGMILRSTGKVRHGIGSIRQDVNLSIKGGDRVEIKGFQDLKSIPKVIKTEIERHQKLIKEKKEVAKEVRKANDDGSTTFMRPMPGSARMYPETDVQPINITKDMIKNIEIPELITEKALRYEKEYNINADLARELVKSKLDIKTYSKKFKNLKPAIIIQILIETPKEIKSRLKIDAEIKDKHFEEVLEKLDKEEINKEAVIEVLSALAQGKKPDYSKYKSADIGDVEEEIKKIVEANPGAPIGGLMGDVMKKFKGAVDGKKAMELLKKYAK